MLEKIRKALRITNEYFDDELNDLIDAALADMELSGIKANTMTDDKLISRAVTLYSKAQFGLENKESEKYQESYESLKRHLALSEEYKK